MDPEKFAEDDCVCWYLIDKRGDPRASPVKAHHLLAHRQAWQAACDGKEPQISLRPRDVTPERLKAAERIVIEAWQKRYARTCLQEALLNIDHGASPTEVRDSVVSGLSEAASGGLVRTEAYRDVAMAVIGEWVGDMAQERPRVLPIPWAMLEAQLGGWPLGKLIVVGGRSSEHKTTLARQAAEHVCRCGFVALYWTAEDSNKDIAGRTLVGSVPVLTTRDLGAGNFRGQRPTELDLQQIGEQAKSHLADSWTTRLRLYDEPNPTIARVCSVIAAEAARGCSLFVIDYFQLCQPDRGDISADATRRLASALAGLAKLLHICIIVTSQIDKGATLASEQEARVPRAAEMLFGSILKQVSHGVLMVGLSKADPRRQPTLEICVEKWKWGEKDTKIVMRVDPSHDRIEE